MSLITSLIEKLPEHIFNKIARYNSHPVADILKASSIFQFIVLKETFHMFTGKSDLHQKAFNYGRHDGSVDVYVLDDFFRRGIPSVSNDEILKCITCYNVGYTHEALQ